MKKINRQNGFSQILILIIISFLAIALPITTKLVQKSQENRSNAATTFYYYNGLSCNSTTAFTTKALCEKTLGTCYSNKPTCESAHSPKYQSYYYYNGSICSLTVSFTSLSNCTSSKGKCYESKDDCESAHSSVSKIYYYYKSVTKSCVSGTYTSLDACEKDTGADCYGDETSCKSNIPQLKCSDGNTSYEVGSYLCYTGGSWVCKSDGTWDKVTALCIYGCYDGKCNCAFNGPRYASGKSTCGVEHPNDSYTCENGSWSSGTDCGSAGCNPTTGRCFGDPATTTTITTYYYDINSKGCISTKTYSSITACNAEHSPCYTSPITCASANSCKTLGGNCKTTCLSTEVSDSNGSGQCSPAKCCVSVICSSSHCDKCGSAYDCSRVGCKWDGSKCASSSSTPTPTPGKGVCSASNCIACIEASKCSSAGCYWETAMKVCAGSPSCSASNCTACSGSVQCKATSGCQWDSVNSAGCFSASKYCGTANSTLVSSLPTGSSACKGASFQPSDSSAADGTYDWACINGSVRSLCSAIKKCVSSTDLPKCSDDSKSLMTCNASGTWNTESCSHGCSNGACKTYYNPDGGASDEIPTPTGIGETTVGGTKLSFKIAFMGVKPSPSCLDNFKTVAITVGKVGTTLSQDLSVSVTGIGETNSSGYGIFKAENVALGTGFSGVSNIYVKIKGSVHSKMYYCASGQSAKNTSQTCTVATDGTINNFYDYPILAGDVDQNGIVNVLDFGLIRNSVFVSGCSKGDLNGDGVVNDFDIKLYKVALEAKYDE